MLKHTYKLIKYYRSVVFSGAEDNSKKPFQGNKTSDEAEVKI